MQLKNTANLDRLLLIRAIAYLILGGLGYYAFKHPQVLCANNRPCECGVFIIACRVIYLLQVTREQVFMEIELSTNSIAPEVGMNQRVGA